MTISHLTGCDSYAKSAAMILGPRIAQVLACIMVCEAMCAQACFMKFLTDLLPRILPELFAGASKAQITGVVFCLTFPASASPDLSVLRHVTTLSLLSLLFVVCLVVVGSLGSVIAPPEYQAADTFTVLFFGREQSRLSQLPAVWSVCLNALCCQHVAIPVYKQLHNSDSRRINKVLLRSCSALTVLYALVATCGLITHGRQTPENVLMAYPSGHRAARAAQLLMGSSLLIAMPLNLHPARDQLPEVLGALRGLWNCLCACILWPSLFCLRVVRRTYASDGHTHRGQTRANHVHLAFASRSHSDACKASLFDPGKQTVSTPCSSRSTARRRILETTILLAVPAVMSCVFPSIASLVGMATGFGSVLWTFVMPVVMVFVLRRRAVILDFKGPLEERLLSSPLASLPESPASSCSASPFGSPLHSPRQTRAAWGAPKQWDTPRRRNESDTSGTSAPATHEDELEEVVGQVSLRLVELQKERNSQFEQGWLEEQAPPLTPRQTTSEAGHTKSDAVPNSVALDRCRGGFYGTSLRFACGVLALAFGTVVGVASACQSVAEVLS